MIQFYFLTILLNALTGYILLTEDEEEILKFNSNFSLKDDNFKFIIGIVSVVTAFLKILSPIEGDVPVLGDLIPGVTGFLGGITLILDHRQNRSTSEDDERSEKINNFFTRNKKIIGVAALIAAALHFLFPKVLLL